MPIVPDNADAEFKDYVYEQFSRIGKALSSPHRLVILNILCQGEHSVESLTKQSGLTIANLSRHLQILKSVNMTCSEHSIAHEAEKAKRAGDYVSAENAAI